MPVTDPTNRADLGTIQSKLVSTSIDTPETRSAFPGKWFNHWVQCCNRLSSAGYGFNVLSAYIHFAPKIAQKFDPQVALDLANSVSKIAVKTGRIEAESLPYASYVAANLLKDQNSFKAWIRIIERFITLAPESTFTLLDKMESLLSSLSVSRLESWILAGIRSSGGNPDQRVKFFSLENSESNRWLLFESGTVNFTSMAPRLRTLIRALWNIGPPLRELPLSGTKNTKLRSSFGRGIIRLPTSFPGFDREQAEDLYRACIAHIGAHFHFSGSSFPVRELKPVQIAVISILEDARVENLAMRKFPGLRNLWLPFHVAHIPNSMSSNQALMAPNLLNKLARALIDHEFNEINGWVKKAKTKFFNCEKEWEKQEISRELGVILGNDLGQMRLGWQFDMKSYIVEPPYRDDNWGLWDFGEEEKPTDILEAEQMFDSIRIEQQLDDNSDLPDQERKETDQDEELSEKPVQLEIQQSEGIPIARYPEFDYLTGRERPDWTTIIDYRPPIGSIKNVERAIEQYAEVLKRITSLIRAARVSRPNRSKRLQEGEYLDIDACIDAKINQRMHLTPDPRVYGKWIREDRDLSVLVLLDISESTRDKVFNSKESVLDLEVHATALLAQAMSQLGDPYAIAAFCSNKRDDVRYFRIKDFNEPFDQKTFSYLGGLEGGFSTRIGAAIRHAGSQLKEQQTYRKLLLVVTDGEPSDIDATDPRYLVEDARRSVKSLSHEGINVFCVGLETKGSSYLEKIFERRNSIVIDRIELLPQKLPLLYLRMTA